MTQTMQAAESSFGFKSERMLAFFLTGVTILFQYGAKAQDSAACNKMTQTMQAGQETITNTLVGGKGVGCDNWGVEYLKIQGLPLKNIDLTVDKIDKTPTNPCESYFVYKSDPDGTKEGKFCTDKKHNFKGASKYEFKWVVKPAGSIPVNPPLPISWTIASDDGPVKSTLEPTPEPTHDKTKSTHQASSHHSGSTPKPGECPECKEITDGNQEVNGKYYYDKDYKGKDNLPEKCMNSCVYKKEGNGNGYYCFGIGEYDVKIC